MTASYDPERLLYIPGRRRFLFLSGFAMAGTVLGRALPQEETLFGYPIRYVDLPSIGRSPMQVHVEEIARLFGVPEHIIAEANPGIFS